MDARLIWDTWRRILTSDALAEAVLAPPEDLSSLGLTPDEQAIFADYASTRAATEQTIFMYRAGLVRNARCALQLTQLSGRLLEASGLDADEVARAFSAANGYRDEGPNLWGLAAAFVAYLAARPELAGAAAQDALAIDAAAIALVRRLAERPPAVWPDDAAAAAAASGATAATPDPDGDARRYLASPAATVASTRHDLTPWLEDPLAFDADAALTPAESRWLVYLPHASAAPACAELSARAARALAYAATPRTLPELAGELGLPAAEARDVIAALVEIGVVTLEPAADTAGAVT